MRRRLIIGLFVAALVATATPIATASASSVAGRKTQSPRPLTAPALPGKTQPANPLIEKTCQYIFSAPGRKGQPELFKFNTSDTRHGYDEVYGDLYYRVQGPTLDTKDLVESPTSTWKYYMSGPLSKKQWGMKIRTCW